MYVELVWDIHFPGKLTRGEEKERKRRKEQRRLMLSTKTKGNKSYCKQQQWRRNRP